MTRFVNQLGNYPRIHIEHKYGNNKLWGDKVTM